MKHIFSIGALILFFSTQISAQLNYHRIYDATPREHAGMSVIANSGGFYILNGVQEAGVTVAASVTSLTPKGDENWTFDYTFGEESTYFIGGELTLLESDTFMLSMLYSNDAETTYNKILAKIDPLGQVVWSKAVGGFVDADVDSVNVALVTAFDTTATMFSTYFGFADTGIETQNYDDNGNVNWSNRIFGTDEQGLPLFIQSFDADCYEADSSYIVGGTSISFLGIFGVGLSKVDSSGNGEWSKLISDDLGALMIGSDLEYLSDTSLVIAGVEIDLATGQFRGHVTYADSIANPVWSKTIDFGPFNLTVVNGVVEAGAGEVLVAGETASFLTGTIETFLIRFSKAGDVVWQRNYPKVFGALSTVSDLIKLPDDYSAYYGSGINTTNGLVNTHLLLTDSMGLSRCEDTISVQVVFDKMVSVDSFSLTTVADTASIELEPMVSPTDSIYDIPTLTIQDTFFCPDDPIEVLLDAFTEGADSYLWETGDTTPTYLALDEGMYIVEATFDNEHGCFTLCDTSLISRLDSVKVNLQADLSQYCEDRTVTFNALASPGLPPYSYLWASGETSPSITVMAPADASVMVTDQCDITVGAAISISQADLPQPDEFTIRFNQDRYCMTGEIELLIQSNPQSNVGGLSNIVWLDGVGNQVGQSVSNLIVPEFGTYSFTAIDNCNFPVGAELTFGEDDLPGVGNISITPDYIPYCEGNEIGLSAQLNGQNIQNFVWDSGETNLDISVPDFGTYMASATDCGRPISTSITVDEDGLPTIGSINISIDDTPLCELGAVLFQAQLVGDFIDISTFEWNTGENDLEIFVDQFGTTYTASAMDCGRDVSESAEFTPNIEEQVRWPNIFFPSGGSTGSGGTMGVDSLDIEFGPFIECPEAVSDYELRVYSRLGNLMFETTDIMEDWDGNKDGNRAPSDAYVFYARYTINEITEEVNGTVTLAR